MVRRRLCENGYTDETTYPPTAGWFRSAAWRAGQLSALASLPRGRYALSIPGGHFPNLSSRVQTHRDELDLARWRIHSLAGRADSRALPFRAVRLVRVRGDSLLQHSPRSGDFPAPGPPPAH